jgi:predicted acetyltransferase
MLRKNAEGGDGVADLILTRPAAADAAAVAELVEDWRAFGGRMNPGLLRAYDGDYSAWLDDLRRRETGEGIGDEVPQTFYFLRDGDAIVGAVSVRHYLNHTNFVDGGHVAYGICPAFRGRGYGSRALALALEKLRELGVDRVLVTCDTDNLPSRRVIARNGGVLENQTVDEDGVPICRYWIARETKPWA